MRWTSKEYSRYKDICVHYDFHFAARTRETAAVISDRFIPACLAWRRALAIMRSKSRMEGVWMVLRIMTSSSPMTINRVPDSKPSCWRRDSGMTTYPLEDMRVVATDSIEPPFV